MLALSDGLHDTLVFWFWFLVVGFLVVNAVAIVLVSLFPALGRDWGLPYRRTRRW